jgi:hypothetical protein
MNKITLILVFSVICNIIYSQPNAKKEYERVYIEAGAMQPLGDLKNQFDTSIDFGFWFRTKIEKSKCIDLGFNLYVPKNAKPFNYTYSDSIFILKPSRFSGMVGLKYCKIFPISSHKKNIGIEWINTLAVEFIFYPPEDERYYDQRNGTTKNGSTTN